MDDQVLTNETIIEGQNTTTAAIFNVSIGLTLLLGLVISWYATSTITREMVMELPVPIMVLYISLVPIYYVGWIIGVISSKPLLKFISHLIIVTTTFVVIDFIASNNGSDIVPVMIEKLGLLALVMMFLGGFVPVLFKKTSIVFILAIIIAGLLEATNVMIYKQPLSYPISITTVVLFGYIGIIWGRSNGGVKSISNGITRATGVYTILLISIARIFSFFTSRRY